MPAHKYQTSEAVRKAMRDKYRKAHGIPLDAPLHSTTPGRPKGSEKTHKGHSVWLPLTMWQSIDEVRHMGEPDELTRSEVIGAAVTYYLQSLKKC